MLLRTQAGLYLLLLLYVNNARGLEMDMESTDALECSLIVKRCYSQCIKNPDVVFGSYVRWTFDQANKSLFCKRYSATDVPNEDIGHPLFISSFDVSCCNYEKGFSGVKGEPRRIDCAPSLSPTTSQQVMCLDEKKLDTLFILGVTSLGSIVLICIFVLIGLLLYKQRAKAYSYGQTSEEGQALVKESEKRASSTGTSSDFGHDKSGCSSPDNQTEMSEHFFGTRTKRNSPRSVRIEAENKYMNGGFLSSNHRENTYRSHGGFVTALTPEKQITSEENHTPSEGISAKRLSSRLGISGEYEVCGGFIKPKRKSVETKSMKLISASEPEREEETNSQSVVSQCTTMCQSPAITSNSRKVIEDPYVQAPPLKSVRSQPKVGLTDSYQKLIPNNSSQKKEMSGYSMLLHNTAAKDASDAKQFLIMNKSSKPNVVNNDNKCEVFLKSTQTPNFEVDVKS